MVPTSIQVHSRLVKNGPDVVSILALGFSPSQDNPPIKTQGEALTCFQVCPSPKFVNTVTKKN